MIARAGGQIVTAKELNQYIDRRNLEKNATYQEILNICMKKIKNCAHNRQYRCVYEVPEFILGSALFDVNEAIKYVMTALKQDCGMYVRYFFPKLIYVSWDMKEIMGKVVLMPVQRASQLATPESTAPARSDAPNPYLMGGGFLPPPASSRDRYNLEPPPRPRPFLANFGDGKGGKGNDDDGEDDADGDGDSIKHVRSARPARSVGHARPAPRSAGPSRPARPITELKPSGKYVLNI